MSYYKCHRCGYESTRLSNFKNHLNRKFICKPKLRDIEIVEIKKIYGIECTSNDLKISSIIPMTSSNIYPKNEDNRICEYCKKVYSSYKNKWRHQKKCIMVEDSEIVEQLEQENNELKTLMQKMLSGIDKDTQIKDQMMDQMKKQNKIIQDMIPRLGNNNNNKFNINVFLNEDCRDAINMSEFIESLQIQLEDLHYTKTNGLIEGISSVFVNGLKQLDTYKRPIHCTDMKRETLYIKDNNEWDREKGKERLRDAISDVANKQRNAIADWELQNPEWSKTDKGKEEYIQLVKSVMTDITEGPTENKIIKSIAKETVIDK